jgi:hypothetical protein
VNGMPLQGFASIKEVWDRTFWCKSHAHWFLGR